MHTNLLLTLALLASPVPSHPDDPVTQWAEDALHFVAELERLHPDPYFGVPREEFEAAVDAFLGGLEGQSENQRQVEFMRLVATLSSAGRDGHTTAWPMAAHFLPLRAYRFADGWFVVAAEDGELVGARILALGGVPIEEACARLHPLLTMDNEWNRRSKLGQALACVEVLDGVGLARDGTSVELSLERAGARETILLRGPNAHGHALFTQPALPARGGARWLEGRDQAFRLEVLEGERTLYVQYNEVTAQARDGTTLADFAAQMVRTFEERGLARLVVDVRSNGGGNNGTFGPLIAALQTPSINRPGVLFGLIGRETFSAAGNFVTVLERETKAILIGEPTGGAPNQYGDAQNVLLPHHRDLLVRLSTRYHQFGKADDARLTHEPHLLVPLRAEEYFAGRDPVLAAALAYTPPK